MEETQDLEVIDSETLPEPPADMSRRASKPTAVRYLDEIPMDKGSGSGWR
ncbi:hypothetical protein [Candidatus Enterococcus mansonii]|nr:hypothetical protein [Enterococcus sp. 4G2_DIV0659]